MAQSTLLLKWQNIDVKPSLKYKQKLCEPIFTISQSQTENLIVLIEFEFRNPNIKSKDVIGQ